MYHSICVLGIDGIRDGAQVFHDFLYLLLHPGRWVEKPVRGEESSGQKLDSFFCMSFCLGQVSALAKWIAWLHQKTGPIQLEVCSASSPNRSLYG